MVVEVPGTGAEEQPLPTLEWETGADGRVGESEFRPGSPLGELVELAGRLTAKTWWPLAAASWFVLTGEVPPSPALRVSRLIADGADAPLRQARLTLDIQPWVSQESVQATYRDQQRWLLGMENREMSVSGLECFRFVEEWRGAHIGEPWESTARAWYEHTMHLGRAEQVDPLLLRKRHYRTRRALLDPVLALGRSAEDMPIAEAIDPRLARLRARQRKQPGRPLAGAGQ
jgi:hypothetical protein